MYNLLAALFFSLIIGTASLAQQTVVFKNGDILSGQILQQDEKTVTLQTLTLGSLELDQQTVAEIHSATLPDDNASQTVPEKKSKSAPDKRTWSGSTAISMTFREASNLDENGAKQDALKWEYYSLVANLQWEKGKNLLNWSSRYRYTQTDEKVFDDFFNIIQNYQYDISPTYFAKIKTLYQQDYRRKIENEQLQTAELGINWINTKKLKLITSAGGAYHNYTRTDRAIKQGETTPPSFSGGKFSFNQSFRWQANGTIALFEQFTHLGNLTAYHSFFKGGVESHLIKNLALQVAYSIEHETEFDYDDKAYYDTKMLTSLHYKF